MNQILKPEKNQSENLIDSTNLNIISKKGNFKVYQFQFIVSSLIAIFFLIIFLIRMIKINENEKLSKQILGQYQISTLYAENSNYIAQDISTNTVYNAQTPFVIGMLKIDKINLNYPILSETNHDLLDLSLCRFARSNAK